jgi:hypothetical protein
MSTKAILLLAFFEGVSVMLIELLGGKMLIPYFGNSLDYLDINHWCNHD